MIQPNEWIFYSAQGHQAIAVAYDGSQPLFQVLIKDTYDLAQFAYFAKQYGRNTVLFAPPHHEIPAVPMETLSNKEKP